MLIPVIVAVAAFYSAVPGGSDKVSGGVACPKDEGNVVYISTEDADGKRVCTKFIKVSFPSKQG